MADRFEVTVVTCAALVPASTPTEIPLGFTTGVLVGFEIVIPPGHAGLTGIAFGFGHQPIIPFTPGSYFSGDDDVIRRVYKDKNAGVPWSAFVCNEDLQLHVWEVRFDYNELPTGTTSSNPATVTADDILAAGVDAMTGP